MRRIKHYESEQGTAVVELALTMPMLLLLSLGVIDVARLIQTSQVLSNAAREGAKSSILTENQGTTGSAIARAQAYITTENPVGCIGTPSVTVNQSVHILPNGAQADVTASQVVVQCTYALKYLPMLSGGTMSPTITLSQTATFRNFY